MTSRDLVRRTLQGADTPRIPRQLWVLPWAQRQYPREVAAILDEFPPDLQDAPVDRPGVPGVRGDPYSAGTYIDEWGCEFVNICPGAIGEVKRPIVASYASDLDKVRPPREWLEAPLDGVNRACALSERFMLGSPGVNPFERMQFLRGTENLLMDLADRPGGFFKLRDRVHEWNLAMIDRWARTEVDGLAWSDDWGTQRALLIRPDAWRELFKPLYADYVARIHAAGKFAFFHSDGYIFDIYEDLIEIGVDAVNSQLFCMDLERIGRRFKGRICFWGEICRQHILPRASSREVRQAVRRVADALYDGHGKVIAQCEFSVGSRPENVRAVFDEWDRIGRGQ